MKNLIERESSFFKIVLVNQEKHEVWFFDYLFTGVPVCCFVPTSHWDASSSCPSPLALQCLLPPAPSEFSCLCPHGPSSYTCNRVKSHWLTRSPLWPCWSSPLGMCFILPPFTWPRCCSSRKPGTLGSIPCVPTHAMYHCLCIYQWRL